MTTEEKAAKVIGNIFGSTGERAENWLGIGYHGAYRYRNDPKIILSGNVGRKRLMILKDNLKEMLSLVDDLLVESLEEERQEA